MKVAHLTEPAEERVVFRDGLGVREVRDTGTGELVEWFHLDPAFAAVDTPLRDRVTRLAKLQHVKFARILSLEAARKDRGPILISSHVPGTRLAEVLEMAGHGLITFEPGAGLQILREVLGALAMLHDSRNVSHGALGPERVVITATGRVVMVEHVLAQALDRLQRPRHQLWREWRVPTPPAAGPVRFDMHTDLAQAGILALAVLLGRPLDEDEYPHRLRGLLPLVQERLGRSPASAVAGDVVAFLERLAPVDSRRAFKTVREAQQAYEGLVSGQAASMGVTPTRVKAVFAAVSALSVAAAPAASSTPVAELAAHADAPGPLTVVSSPGLVSPAASLDPITPEPTPVVVAAATPDSDIDIEALLALEVELEGGTSPARSAVRATPDARASDAEPPTSAAPVDAVASAPLETPDLDVLAQERADLERQFADLVAAVAPPAAPPVYLAPEAAVTTESLVDALVRWSSMPVGDQGDPTETTETVAVPAAPEESITAWLTEPLPTPAMESDGDHQEAVPFADTRVFAHLDVLPEGEPLAPVAPEQLLPDAATGHTRAEWWKEALPWLDDQQSRAHPTARSASGAMEDETSLAADEVSAVDPVEASPSTAGVGQDFGYIALDAIDVSTAGVASPLDVEPAAEPQALEPVSAEAPTSASPPDDLPLVLGDHVGDAADQAAAVPDAADGPLPFEVAESVADDRVVTLEAFEPATQAAATLAPPSLPQGECDGAAEADVVDPAVADASPVSVEANVAEPPPALAEEPYAEELVDQPAGEPVDESVAQPGDQAGEVSCASELRAAEEPAAEPAITEPAVPETPVAAPAVVEPAAADPPADAHPVESPAPALPPSLRDHVPEVVVVDDGHDQNAWDHLPSELPAFTLDLSSTPVAPAAATPVTSAAAKKKRRRARRKQGAPLDVMDAAVVAPLQMATPAPAVVAPPMALSLTLTQHGVEKADADGEASRGVRLVPWLNREVPAWTPAAEPGPTPMPHAQLGAADVAPLQIAGPQGALAVMGTEATRPFEQEIRAVGMPDVDDRQSRGSRASITAVADAMGTPAPTFESWYATTVSPVGSRGINWRRLIAASVLIALFQGAAFAAWWWVQPGARGTLVVQTGKTGVEVLLDDKVVGRTPFREDIAPGRHKLQLREGGNVREMPVEISVGVVTTQAIDWPSSGAGKGNLQVTSNPAGAEIFVNGRSRGKAPQLLENLPAGDQLLMLRGDAGSVTVTATVLAGETNPLEVKIFAGWIQVDAAVELNLLLNGRQKIGSSMDGQILLPPGVHRVQVLNESLGIRQWLTMTVEPGAVKRVPFIVQPGTLTLQEEAEVFLDGASAGTTPGTISIAPGTHEISIRHADGTERRQAMTVRAGQRVQF